MNRIEANKQIIKKLEEFINNNPNMRFIQALWALNIINAKPVYNKELGYHEQKIEDRFYEEPSETLKRIGYSE